MSKAIREAEKRARERVAAKVKPTPIERHSSNTYKEEDIWRKFVDIFDAIEAYATETAHLFMSAHERIVHNLPEAKKHEEAARMTANELKERIRRKLYDLARELS